MPREIVGGGHKDESLLSGDSLSEEGNGQCSDIT